MNRKICYKIKASAFVLLISMLLGMLVSCGVGHNHEQNNDNSDNNDSNSDVDDNDSEKDETDLKLLEIKEFIIEKQRKNCMDIGADFLHATDKNGVFSSARATEWTIGFYPGLNYLCYEMSGLQIFKSTNEKMLELTPPYDKLGHDIGMVYSPFTYADYRIFGNAESRQSTIEAGEALVARFHENGEYINAWDWGGSINENRMIIDTMYNVPLLYRCYELTGDKKFYNVAVAHTDTAMKYLVRDDYTTAHTFVFNPDGTPAYGKTHQGYADDSCWARGQAWAISGFAMAYRFTGNRDYLDTAVALSEKYLQLTEKNLIPKWDLIFKNDPNQPVDTSAAAIAANGFMEIYDATGNEIYKEYAYSILVELYENYSSKDMPSYQGLIREAVGNMPENKNISVTLIYGDYFFAELLSRFLGTSRGYW